MYFATRSCLRNRKRSGSEDMALSSLPTRESGGFLLELCAMIADNQTWGANPIVEKLSSVEKTTLLKCVAIRPLNHGSRQVAADSAGIVSQLPRHHRGLRRGHSPTRVREIQTITIAKSSVMLQNVQRIRMN